MPLLVATVAFYMFKAGGKPGTLFYASLGAAVYGIWSSTLFGSGGAIQWQRWQGTLELLVSAPAPFILRRPAADDRDLGDRHLLAGLDAALGPRSRSGSRSTSSSRSRSWSRCRRRSSGSGCSGLLFASTFVLYRHANALSNMLEWPVLLVTGMLVPLSLLPGLGAPDRLGARADLGRAGDPRGGARRRRRGRTSAMTLALGAAYLALGALFLRYFERRAPASTRPSR